MGRASTLSEGITGLLKLFLKKYCTKYCSISITEKYSVMKWEIVVGGIDYVPVDSTYSLRSLTAIFKIHLSCCLLKQ